MLLCGTSCQSDVVLPPGVDHPDPANLESEGLRSSGRLYLADDAPNDPRLRWGGLDSLAVSDVEWTGSLGGDEAYVFGSVTDAYVGRAEDYLIVDRRLGRIMSYAPSKGTLLVAARSGAGPGEVLDPRAIFGAGDQVGVVDVTARIHYFDAIKHAYQYSDAIGVEGLDACEVGGRVFVLAFSAAIGEMIHEVQGGEIVNSFARPYETDDELVRHSLSEGQLECDAERGMVYFALERVPQVLAYDLGGALRWAVELGPPFEAPLLRETTDRRVLIGLDPRRPGMNMLSRVTLLEAGKLVVQHSRYRMASESVGGRRPPVPVGLDTWVVDVAGCDRDACAAWFAGSDIPALIGAGRGQVVLGREDPFPAVALVSYGEGAR